LLEALAERTGETTTLSAPSSPDAVTIDFVQAPGSVVSVAELGRPSVAHATAAGKVGLAFGEAELEPGRLIRFTDRTITDRAQLDFELDEVRRQGYARAEGEREPDLNAIAAPVFGPGGGLAAIVGVQGPASRFNPRTMSAAVGELQAISLGMSHALGFDPELTKERQ
jgi:IclR family acetate operon transcriptional repressor